MGGGRSALRGEDEGVRIAVSRTSSLRDGCAFARVVRLAWMQHRSTSHNGYLAFLFSGGWRWLECVYML